MIAGRVGRRAAIIGALAIVGATVVAGPASASNSGATTKYATTVSSCDAPAAGHASCFAERLVPAAKNTPGAAPLSTTDTFKGETGHGYSPAQLATAYGYNPGSAVGATQTVGIIDAYADPNALADLKTFDAQYGLPADTTSSLRIVNQSGQATPLPATDNGWASEISLDLDAVRGVCHQCKIILVETNDNSYANLETGVATAVALGADEISNSYGGYEYSGLSAAAYNYPGVVITASTGDHGWRDWDRINAGNAVSPAPEFPSSAPDVVAVGGTKLDLSASDARSSETVWNEDGADDYYNADSYGATGGGCSILFDADSWQSHVAGWANTGCGTSRLAADISALADPYTGYDIYDSVSGGGWQTYGGTSLASPMVAAMWALAGGAAGVQYPAMTLYGHAGQASAFYDVTVGGNSYCGGDDPTTCAADGWLHSYSGGANTPNGTGYGTVDCSFAPYPSTSGTVNPNNTECNAVAGYDGPSGVGTPNGLSGFAKTGPAGTITKPSLLKLHQAAAFHISATDPIPGSTISSYSWSWGDGSAASTGTGPSHSYSAAGTYTVTVTMTDNKGFDGTAVASVTVGKKPVIAASGPSSLKVGKKGTFKVKSGDLNTGGAISKLAWKFGDGSTGSGPKVKHAFSKAGSYKVKVIATDNSGLKAHQKLKVKVTK